MQGLTKQEVEERISKGLLNTDVQIKTKTIWQIISGHMFTMFNLVILILALCVAMVNSYKNMTFAGVAVWNLVISVFQEIKAKRIIDKLSLMSNPKIVVVRDGRELEVMINEIVMDDILLLQNGNQIPADCIVCKGQCQVNEGLITGESEPIFKQTGDELLSGSFVVSGHVYAKVIHIGIDNYVSKITSNAKYIKKPNSHILNFMNVIIKYISICLIPIGVLLYVHQYNVVGNFKGAILGTVAGVVGMIPSGLVLLTTIVMAVSVIRLAKYNTLIQEMCSVETLARVDVLCLDKTGTITEGKMQVDSIEYLSNKISDEYFENVMHSFCKVLGDNNPTFFAVNERFNNVEGINDEVEQIIPFSSDKKYSGVIFKTIGKVVMGAPEFVLGEKYSDELKKEIDKYSSNGKRVVVVCIDEVLAAMIVIGDIIRKEARETLEYFKNQGVIIKIISGDNPVTVSKVAEEAGMKNASCWINATELKSDEDIYEAVRKYTVFGRVTPEQKYKMIKALKSQGHVVAMTGDGSNDVMALREADCSIAMQSGSDAARNASQLVLLDSDFSSMPKIVEEGRRTINNIERSAVLYLSKTIYSIVLGIIFIFVNMTYPFLPIQFTLIGALSIGIPSFILGLQPNKNLVKGDFLTNVLKKAIPGGIIVVLNIVSGIVVSFLFKLRLEHISTMCTILMAVSAMIILLDVCRPINKLRGIMFLCLVLGFVCAFNFMEELFGITKVNIEICLFIIVCGIITYVVHTCINMLIKYIFNRKLSNDL